VVHQLNIKNMAGLVDKRPTPEALKGSGAYYEVADTVLAWYRPSFYQSVPDDKVECHILKQRYGKYPQVVELDWDPEYGTISNGHTIEVERPSEVSAQDNFLGEALKGKVRAKGRRRL
jgi:replicative DNA helicase